MALFDKDTLLNAISAVGSKAVSAAPNGVVDAINKRLTCVGYAAGADFPADTKVYLPENEEESSLKLEAPSGDVYIITHDIVKNAQLCAMGVTDLRKKGHLGDGMKTMSVLTNSSDDLMEIHGAKYLVELNDGKRVMLTVNAVNSGVGNTLQRTERVLF